MTTRNSKNNDTPMDIKERLIYFIKYLRVSQRAFQAIIGVSSCYINNIVNNIGTDILSRIELLFPELNMQWLIYGSGEMLTKSIGKRPTGNNQGRVYDVIKWSTLTIEEFCRVTGIKVKRIEGTRVTNEGSLLFRAILQQAVDFSTEEVDEWIYQPILETYPQVSKEWLINSTGYMLNGVDESPVIYRVGTLDKKTGKFSLDFDESEQIDNYFSEDAIVGTFNSVKFLLNTTDPNVINTLDTAQNRIIQEFRKQGHKIKQLEKKISELEASK